MIPFQAPDEAYLNANEQRWKRLKATEGYFLLKQSTSSMFLTGTSANGCEIKGNN